MSIAIIILVIFLIILTIYAWLAIKSGGVIIRSEPLSESDISEGDLIYYLPTANLQINVTATIVTVSTMDADKNDVVQSAKLTALAFETLADVVPDTSQALTLNYQSSIFMSDELRLTTNGSGLLDTVMATTEDRLNGIISQVADSASKIAMLSTPFIMDTSGLAEDAGEQSTKTSKYPATFLISAADIQQKSLLFPWVINIDGTVNKTITVDASFNADINPLNPPTKVADVKSTNGILTRPLQTIRLTITSSALSGNKLSSTNDVQIPDPSRLVNIPVTRSSFVKKVNTPKFCKGLIVENYINQPSEVEGFVSIPINIGKALISIPAQIFNFKIQHKYQNQIADLTLQNKVAELEKQLKANQPPGVEPPRYQ